MSKINGAIEPVDLEIGDSQGNAQQVFQQVSDNFIDWNSILRSYGSDTRETIKELLARANVSDSDPAALVIAAQFLSLVDVTKSFNSVSETIESGKTELDNQFTSQILQLRGLVSFAEEKLKTEAESSLESNKDKLLAYIKEGVALAISRENNKTRHLHGATVLSASISAVIFVFLGFIFSSMMFYKLGVRDDSSSTRIIDGTFANSINFVDS